MGQPHRLQDGALLGPGHEGTPPAHGTRSLSVARQAETDGDDILSLTLQPNQWALVLAGIADFGRPAEKLSLQQNGALTATGLIWTRWCLIIKPKNYLLAAVNFFLGIVGVVQVTRIMLWRNSQKDINTVTDAVVEAKDEAKEAVKSA